MIEIGSNRLRSDRFGPKRGGFASDVGPKRVHKQLTHIFTTFFRFQAFRKSPDLTAAQLHFLSICQSIWLVLLYIYIYIYIDYPKVALITQAFVAPYVNPDDNSLIAMKFMDKSVITRLTRIQFMWNSIITRLTQIQFMYNLIIARLSRIKFMWNLLITRLIRIKFM